MGNRLGGSACVLATSLLLGPSLVLGTEDSEVGVDGDRALIFVEIGSDAAVAELRACRPRLQERLGSSATRFTEAHSPRITVRRRNGIATRVLLPLSPVSPAVVVVPAAGLPRVVRLGGDCQRLVDDVEGVLASARAEAIAQAETVSNEACAASAKPETLGCENRRLAASCDAGDMAACNKLGYRYLVGRGLPTNEATAATLFEKGCAAGFAKSCHNLGLQFVRGVGVPKDTQRGASLLRKACNLGFEAACSAGE